MLAAANRRSDNYEPVALEEANGETEKTVQDEKLATSDTVTAANTSASPATKTTRRLSPKAIKLFHCSLLISLVIFFLSYMPQCHPGFNLSLNPVNVGFSWKNVQDFPSPLVATTEDSDATAVHEYIEIPYFPAKDLGKPVKTVELISESFGQSWGHVVSANYTAPTFDFNRVILDLNVNVSGVQYDRLINVYLDDVEIWRSSTIEPHGENAHYNTTKDVSSFLTLFKSNSILKFQLDNLINSRLTGVFDVSLKAHYYNAPVLHHNQVPADKVINILPIKNSDDGSIVYLPDVAAKAVLPSINSNTTKVQLLVTTSGNAEEEFWYSNVLDEIKDTFAPYGHKLFGHGPCRVINVFLDDIRIHSFNPKPTVFTGGISPALWNPIVSNSAFHIDPLMLDITPVLPWLWNNQDGDLRIEISNCLDDDDKTVKKTGYGSNWITSASLSIWEDSEIVDAYGEILSFDNTTKVSGFGMAPPFAGVLNQVVSAKYTNTILSNITMVYQNGTEVSHIKEQANQIDQTVLTFMKAHGDLQSIVYLPKTNDTLSILDSDMTPLETFKFKFSDSLNVDLNSTIIKSDPFSSLQAPMPDIELQVNITKQHKFKMSHDDLTIINLKAKENGTSDFVISPNGNHGVGEMEHTYKLMGIGGKSYERHALGSNGTLIYDDVVEDVKAKSARHGKKDCHKKGKHPNKKHHMKKMKHKMKHRKEEDNIMDFLTHDQREILNAMLPSNFGI